MKKNLLIITLFSTLAMVSCKKANNQDPAPAASTVNNITPPAGFTWENSRNINFTINIADSRFQNSIYLVAIYDANPATGGNLLAKGSATILSAFVSKLYIARQITQVYIVKTAPDGSKASQTIQVGTADINTSIGA